MKLKEIAEVKTGLVLSRKKGCIQTQKLLTLASIDAVGKINRQALDVFANDGTIDKNYYTQVQDIVMRLTNSYTAVYIDESNAGIIIPSNFVKIQITDERFLAEYVKLCLNSPYGKEQIKKEERGSVIVAITASAIRELDIPLLSIQKQKQLIDYMNHYYTELELLDNIKKKQIELYEETLYHIIK